MSTDALGANWQVWNPDRKEWETGRGHTWDGLKLLYLHPYVKMGRKVSQWDGYFWRGSKEPVLAYSQLWMFPIR